MESGENIQEGTGNAAACNQPQPSLSVAAAKKQKASEEKASRDSHLLRLINNTYWQEADSLMVKGNMLKQIIGFDPAVFFVDMLRKNSVKLNFVSLEYTKVVCLETFLKYNGFLSTAVITFFCHSVV
jgi:hypothetical protein